MKRETKRILALILVVVMVIYSMEAPVLARKSNLLEKEGQKSTLDTTTTSRGGKGASATAVTTPSGVTSPGAATTPSAVTTPGAATPSATTTPGSASTSGGICTHAEADLEIFVEEAATCTGAGIGYKKCKKCGEVVEKDVVIEPLGHHGGKATCGKQAICEHCQQGYGELDKSRHGKLEIRNAKPATCKEAGYSGDVHCKECGDMTMRGESIPKTEIHTWDEGKVTKKATVEKTGIKTYTCMVCGTTKTEEITVVGAAKGSILIDSSNKAEYEVTKAGLTGGTVSYVQPVNEKATNITIPATIKVNGITYKVTAISKNACMNLTKLKKVTIGKNVKKIGTKAFFGCKKLTKIKVNTKKLTMGNVGKSAVKGVYKKAVFNVPNSKKEVYKKIFKRRGGGEKIKVK